MLGLKRQHAHLEHSIVVKTITITTPAAGYSIKARFYTKRDWPFHTAGTIITRDKHGKITTAFRANLIHEESLDPERVQHVLKLADKFPSTTTVHTVANPFD